MGKCDRSGQCFGLVGEQWIDMSWERRDLHEVKTMIGNRARRAKERIIEQSLIGAASDYKSEQVPFLKKDSEPSGGQWKLVRQRV